MVFSKKRSSFEISPDFLRFVSNFVPNQRCSLFRSEIKVIAQEFVGHATHDLNALTARHWATAK